jgi:hypothetical protein
MSRIFFGIFACFVCPLRDFGSFWIFSPFTACTGHFAFFPFKDFSDKCLLYGQIMSQIRKAQKQHKDKDAQLGNYSAAPVTSQMVCSLIT